MKKYISIILCILTMTTLVSCNQESKTGNVNKDNKTNKSNEIYSVELTKEEEEILQLVGSSSDINIYEFNVSDEYKSISVWLEVYKDGELISNVGEFISETSPEKSRIAVKVEGDQNEKWLINNEGSSVNFELDQELRTDIGFSAGWGSFSEPIKIESEKEILLMKYLFSEEDSISSFENQYYMENPEVMKDYDYAYLLKCKFSKKDINSYNYDGNKKKS